MNITIIVVVILIHCLDPAGILVGLFALIEFRVFPSNAVKHIPMLTISAPKKNTTQK